MINGLDWQSSANQICLTFPSTCPLPSCKKLGRSLEPLWRKGQKGQKALVLNSYLCLAQHLIPYNLIFFQKKHLAQTMGPIVLNTHAKNWVDP